jgi:hypothetical protein
MVLTAQRMGSEYRTAIDSLNLLHYITFNRDSSVIVRFPSTPGVFIRDTKAIKINWYFTKKGNSIRIKTDDPIEMVKENIVTQRLANSNFTINQNNTLYDQNSGFTYVLKKSIKNNKYGAFAIDGKIYMIRKRNPIALKKKIKDIQPDQFTNNYLRGRAAYDKYGIKGINGVIEINKK